MYSCNSTQRRKFGTEQNNGVLWNIIVGYKVHKHIKSTRAEILETGVSCSPFMHSIMFSMHLLDLECGIYHNVVHPPSLCDPPSLYDPPCLCVYPGPWLFLIISCMCLFCATIMVWHSSTNLFYNSIFYSLLQIMTIKVGSGCENPLWLFDVLLFLSSSWLADY